MATKVIINGGWPASADKSDPEFFTEILKDTKNNLNILLILFAEKAVSAWEEKSKYIINEFNSVKINKVLNFVIAEESKLKSQVESADIVYIRGGNTPVLLDVINKIPSFISWLRGKIVAGESAGTYLLSTCFFSKTIGETRRGIGLLPIKSICHFEGINEEQLDKCPQSLEKVLLRELEHKVYFLN
jgi:peptidase E